MFMLFSVTYLFYTESIAYNFLHRSCWQFTHISPQHPEECIRTNGFSIAMHHFLKKHFCHSADVTYGQSAFLMNTNMANLNHIIFNAISLGKYRFESAYIVYEYTFWEVVGFTMQRSKIIETPKVRCVTTTAGTLATAYPIPYQDVIHTKM